MILPLVVSDIWQHDTIESEIWFGDEFSSYSEDVITDHISRAQSLFITQFKQTREVVKNSRFIPFVLDNDPITGGVVIDVEEPITNHLEKAKSLFITQFKKTRTL
jgi:hypothetical protein